MRNPFSDLGESSSHFQEWKWKKRTFLGEHFPEVNISVNISKDKAQALNIYKKMELSMTAHEVYDPLLLNLFCTQSCHDITG